MQKNRVIPAPHYGDSSVSEKSENEGLFKLSNHTQNQQKNNLTNKNPTYDAL